MGVNQRIEPCTALQLPAFLELLRSAGLPEAGLARHADTLLLGAWEGERLVGCAAVEVYDRFGLLRSVAVESDSRGSGLGRRLTQAALNQARGRRLAAVYLLTETAESFFAAQGFTRTDRASAPAGLRASEEFAVACPEEATCMVITLEGRSGDGVVQ